MPSCAPATYDLYTLSLHDALPIFQRAEAVDQADLLALVDLQPDLLGQHDGRDVGHEPGADDLTHPRSTPLPRCFAHHLHVRVEVERSEEHTSELQSHSELVCRLALQRHTTSTLFPYTTLFRSFNVRRPSTRLISLPWLISSLIFSGSMMVGTWDTSPAPTISPIRDQLPCHGASHTVFTSA